MVDRMKEKNEEMRQKKKKKGTQKHLHLLRSVDNISMLTGNVHKYTHTSAYASASICIR